VGYRARFVMAPGLQTSIAEEVAGRHLAQSAGREDGHQSRPEVLTPRSRPRL